MTKKQPIETKLKGWKTKQRWVDTVAPTIRTLTMAQITTGIKMIPVPEEYMFEMYKRAFDEMSQKGKKEEVGYALSFLMYGLEMNKLNPKYFN